MNQGDESMNLNELFSRQAELDNRIVEEHNLHDQDLKKKKVLAGIVELAEAVNEARFFKFWSKDQKARTTGEERCFACEGAGRFVYPGEFVDGNTYTEGCAECQGTGWIPTDKNPLLEEYIDVIHFTLSIALEYGYTEHTYKQPKQTDLTDRALDIVYLLSSLPYVQDKVRHNHIGLIFDYVIALGEQFGFTEELVIDAYLEKNKVNFERQETGY